MQILLKRRILAITEALRKSGKDKLAGCIEENWDKTCLEYSKELNFWRPKRPMEKELVAAFGKELERLHVNVLWKDEILDSMKKRRVIQTTPHLGVTEGPRFFCVNWLGSLGVPEGEFYIAAMYSGVPFSNHTRPGRINRKEGAVNLFPSTMQDALVYRSVIPPKLVETMDSLPKNISKFFHSAEEGGSYTGWALESCQHIERKALKKNNLVYVDINEVVSHYLVAVLENRFHVLHKIFFDPKTRREFTAVFPEEIMFYAPVLNGKYEEMESFFMDGNVLRSKSREIPLEKNILIRKLSEGRLCPALLPGFFVLAFLNQFKCFGSFAQVEYLPAYQKKLAGLSFLRNFHIESVATSNLTTGFFPGGKNLFPLDILVDKKKFKPKENMLFGELLVDMKDSLLGSYFTGSTRNRHAEKK